MDGITFSVRQCGGNSGADDKFEVVAKIGATLQLFTGAESRCNDICGSFAGHELAQLHEDADADLCEGWLRVICHQVGPGFHLDTSAGDYTSEDGSRLLSDAAASRLDADVSRALDLLGNDAYDICADEIAQIMTDDDSRSYGPRCR